MKTLALPLKFAAAFGLSVFSWAALFSSVRGSDVWANLPSRPHNLVGTLSCSSISCHGQLEPPASSASSHGQAYHLWLAGDPHARAGQRILEPRFQEVLKRASNRSDGAADSQMYAQCAKCHDPLGNAAAHPQQPSALIPTLSQRERGPAVGRGISCESCHGPAREWLSKHYERDISREELRELGMTDTKNVLVRARLCAACHVGSGENDVTHDMLAAGHPPLRFEMAAHQALLERKHWNDGPRRQSQPDYELQLWAAGRIASAEAALALLEERANRAATETQMNTDRNKAAWPELAEYNCFACHQALRPEVGRKRLESSSGRAPGVPPWQRWNVECVPSSTAFDDALVRLGGEMETSYFASPEKVARLAADARVTLRRTVHVSDRGEVCTGDAAPLGILTVLRALETRPREFTWDRACHELAALIAIECSVHDAPLAKAFSNRAACVGRSLAFQNHDSEWPAALANLTSEKPPAAGTMSLDEIRQQLDALRRELTAQ